MKPNSELPQLTKEQAIELIDGPFGCELMKVACKYIAPIFWRKPNEKKLKVNNGTIFFVDTGQKIFAVTASHVYEDYIKAKQQDQKIICQIDGLVFDPVKRIIDNDGNLDIATFNISKKEITKLNCCPLTGSQHSWPPSAPQEGKGVFFAGFPGQERVHTEPNNIDFCNVFVLCVATNIAVKTIMCHFEKDYTVPGSEFPSDDYPLGGISGAPLIAIVQNKVMSWRLAGVIHTAGKETIYATHASFINADGTLKKN